MLVGSRVLEDTKWRLGRPPSDIDYILSWEHFEIFRKTLESFEYIKVLACYPLNDSKWVIKQSTGTIIEVEIAWEGSSGESLIKLDRDNDISPLDLLYTLKMSHRYLKDSPHFLKTMSDIKTLRNLGGKIPDCLKEWYKVREEETYHYQHPKLNQSKEEFFDTKGVVYEYDHDTIHEAVNLSGKPAYTYFKPDDKEVLCDKGMFFDCTEEVRLSAVFEESCVLAIERSLVPFGGWDEEDKAFNKALEKVCTSITSGWFREFAWENYDKVVSLKEMQGKSWLHRRFTSGIMTGTIKEFKK